MPPAAHTVQVRPTHRLLWKFPLPQPSDALSHTPAPVLTCPLMGSGLLTTADSATAGCSARAFSTSAGPMRYLRDQRVLLRGSEQMPGLE